MAITASVTPGFTFSPGEEITSASLDDAGLPTVTIATPISIANGGTNANAADDARVNLGLGTIATQNVDDVDLTGGEIEDTTITLKQYAVAGLPSGSVGKIVYCTDGDGGNPCLAVYSTAWKRVVLGATVST